MSSYNDVLTQLNMLNNSLRFGSFMLDPESGWLLFKYGYIYINARPSEELVLSLVSMVVQTVDEHDGDLKKIIPVNTNIPDPCSVNTISFFVQSLTILLLKAYPYVLIVCIRCL